VIDETLRFDTDAGYPLIHYEQHTWLRPSSVPQHLEAQLKRV
jgi:hypothetical protein